MYHLIKQEGAARRGRFETVHGTVQTPAFMNVATAGAIKGAVSAYDLKDLHCQVQLCNTYHLHLRPGDETVKKLGGIRKFTGWDGPVLTDSGGFQVFSLAKLRNIKEEGVTFASHVDGHKIFMGPEESMRIQSNLGSTIAMAFDECVENPATYEYAKASCERTARWLERCKKEMARLNSLEDTINPHQLLFGINQGCTFEDLRVEHMKRIAELDLDGYAIGGLAVGEPTEEMKKVYHIVLEAQRAGIAAARAGVPGKSIDAAARKVIEDAGYGDYFGHGYGHSVGIEIHESPNANTREETIMPVGAAVSAEPGIYLPGRFGVRIEDVTILTADGCIDITKSPKELIIL